MNRAHTRAIPGVFRCAALTASAALTACAPRHSPPNINVHDPDAPVAGIPGQLAPERLRIHPLTRLATTGPDGALRLACHVELKDQFGHATKGLGHLRIELYRPVGGGDGESQDLVWEIDLSDPTINATFFDDLITRTYVIHLSGLPAWVAELQSSGGTLALRALFTPAGAAGGAPLEAGYRMTK
ncbi:MAG: hypothetical protein H7Y88_08330 [Phycisphaerales bacterium]|nr:hypothetical protein [Phycisphaerales bacterium]